MTFDSLLAVRVYRFLNFSIPLNQALVPALGFVNPLLYAKGASAFNDITTGNNPGCGTPGFNVSFQFVPGYSAS
jgi:hypothetical protein